MEVVLSLCIIDLHTIVVKYILVHKFNNTICTEKFKQMYYPNTTATQMYPSFGNQFALNTPQMSNGITLMFHASTFAQSYLIFIYAAYPSATLSDPYAPSMYPSMSTSSITPSSSSSASASTTSTIPSSSASGDYPNGPNIRMYPPENEVPKGAVTTFRYGKCVDLNASACVGACGVERMGRGE